MASALQAITSSPKPENLDVRSSYLRPFYCRFDITLRVLATAPAYAAGTNMPWEQPLQQILDSIQGSVAKVVSVIVIIVTGLTKASPRSPAKIVPRMRIIGEFEYTATCGAANSPFPAVRFAIETQQPALPLPRGVD